MEENMQQTPVSQEMPPTPPMAEKKSGGMWTIVVVIVIIVLALLWWQFGAKDDAMMEKDDAMMENTTEVSPEVPVGTVEDTTPVLTDDLQGIDTGDLEKEFQQLDADMKNL